MDNKVEKVKSALADPWMHICRPNRGTFRSWLKATDDDPLCSATYLAAITLCDSAGNIKWPKLEDALANVDSLDWQLVAHIAEQAAQFSGFDMKLGDAEKNS